MKVASNKLLIAGLALTVAGGFALPAAADLVVSYSANAPQENVYVSHIVANPNSVEWHGQPSPGVRRDVGQSFFVTNNIIMQSFSLQLGGSLQTEARNAGITMTIYQSDTQTAIGTVVGSQSGQYLGADSGAALDGWVTFTIDDVNLVGGNYYTVMLSFDELAVNRRQALRQQTAGNSFADGRRWFSDGSTLSDSVEGDLAFSVQAIPEPGSVSLMIIGLSGALLCRRMIL